MDRVDGIMERLGFNKDANDGVKAAFLKNLIKQAYGVEVPLPPQYEAQIKKQTLEEYAIAEITRQQRPREINEQLSFDFDDPSKAG